MNNPVEHKISKLVQQIEQRYQNLKRKQWASRFLIPLCVFLVGTGLFIWVEQQVYFSSATKILIGLSLALLCATIMWWNKQEITFQSLSEFYASVSDGIQKPALKHALDLSLKGRDRQLRLYQAAVEKNIESFSWDKVKPKVDRQVKDLPSARLFRRSLGAMGLAIVFLAASAFVHPDAFMRTAQFWSDFQKPNPYNFTVTPGNTTIEQGGTFQPSVSFSGSVPQELLLGIKTDVENQFRFRPLQETGDNTFTGEAIQLSSNASYYIKMDAFGSQQYQVDVQLRPRFESLSVEVFPPEYTRLDSSRFTYPFSQVKAYQGSRVRIIGQANKPLSRLRMIASERSDTLSPDTQDTTLYTFVRSISASDTLQFAMEDPSGLANSNDFSFTIDAVQDEHPFAELLDPTENIKMSTPSPLEITYRASDDFGITSATLNYEVQRAFVEQPETGTIKLGAPPLNAEQTYTWDVPALDIKPRDQITFWIEVADNDRYNGFKTSQTRKLTITLPSLVENIEDIDKQETDVQQNLENVSESFEEMKKEYDRFKEDLKQNPETNYEQKQMLKEVQDKQEEIDKQVEELNKKFEQIRQDINKNDLVSEDTRRAYEELQKLMEEIDDPELKKALEELQKSLGNFNQQQLRKALEDYEFKEKQYQERLQRTIELFKSLKMNSDLEKMAKVLDDLAQKENELSESEAPPSEQAEQQEAIQNDTEKVSKQLEKLNENTPEKAQQKINDLQQQSQQELDSIKKQIQKNIEELKQQDSGSQDAQNQQNQQQQQQPQNGQQQNSRQQQQQIQQQFQQLSQQMRNAKQQFSQQRMQVNITALQNILYNLVTLSNEQEDLTQSTEYLSNRSQAFVEKARVEKNISQQFAQISDSLFSVSSQIPGFSNRINTKKMEVEQHLQQAVEQLAERNKSQSTYAERQSLGGINELASMVASLLDQLQNQQQSGMGGGMSMQQFMEQMQNMSGSQQQLNQQIQQLINDIQGDRLTRDQIDRLNQMAKQQNRIRKQLEELQQEGGLEAGDKMLSELERMAEEMEKTINDLRGGNTNGELVKRQENILSRMLNAEKAMQERGKKDEREGTSADEETPRSVPPDMTLEELQKKMRNLLNDPSQTQFSDDYQRLIEQYFELLKELEGRGPTR